MSSWAIRCIPGSHQSLFFGTHFTPFPDQPGFVVGMQFLVSLYSFLPSPLPSHPDIRLQTEEGLELKNNTLPIPPWFSRLWLLLLC